MQKTPSLMEKPPFLMEKPPVLMTDFQRSYTVLLFNNILPHGNFWQYNGSPLNIFVLYTEAHFLSLFLSLWRFTTVYGQINGLVSI